MANNTKTGPAELPFGRTLFVTIHTENGDVEFEGPQAGAALQALENGEPIISGSDGTIRIIPSSSVIYATWFYAMSDALPPEDDNCKGGDEPSPEPTPEPGTFKLTNGTGESATLFVVTHDIEPGTYGDMTFEEPEEGVIVASVTLGPGESATATGLPDGTEVAVFTNDVEFYSGVVPSTYVFTTGNLVLTTAGDVNGGVSISLGASVNGVFGDAEFEDGLALIILEVNQTYTIGPLPTGMEFTLMYGGYGQEYVVYDPSSTGNFPANVTISINEGPTPK